MADNLPLIPGKRAVCADVTPVLREVFREMDQLPPLAAAPQRTSATDEEKLWIKEYNSERADISYHEADLKGEFAKRISKKPPRNIYSLCKPSDKEQKTRQRERTMIERMDLMPGIEQNAAGDKSLWVQNTLNRSSCDFSISQHEQSTSKLQNPLTSVGLDGHSAQTFSTGELEIPMPPPPPPEIMVPLPPQYIHCIPQEIYFINFNLGQAFIQELKLINLSKFEIRLSVTLPRRHELGVELSTAQWLRITAGSCTKLKITFRPLDPRTFRDQVSIRTSIGRGPVVPILCYMEPPQLHLFVQRKDATLDVLSDSVSENLSNGPSTDVIDLGTRLLGDEHKVPLVMQCSAVHSQFCLLTEDAWVDWTVEEITFNGSLKTGPFTFHPALWAGGGVTEGVARCQATTTGFHHISLRILSSTAITRVLHVFADTLYYSPDHIHIQAHEKNYDINSDDDPDCEYYLNLGTAFPNRSLSATVHIINHSAAPYSFYWQFRPWGVCTCWKELLASPNFLEQEDETVDYMLCPGAQLAKQGLNQSDERYEEDARLVRVEPEAGALRERGACAVRVHTPDAGARLGTHRAVLLLILKDIPIESFKPKFVPNAVSSRIVEEIGPDGEIITRELCDIVQAQMEVWWEVVPVRFVLDPPVLLLTYSRRVKSVTVPFRATQLYGSDNVPTRWVSSAPITLPSGPILSPLNSVSGKLRLMLPSLPNEYPEPYVITLMAETGEWEARLRIVRACATRHPALTPARHGLGVVPPEAKVSADIEVFNSTHQKTCWWATPYRWTGENMPSKQCRATRTTCSACRERACTCSLIGPSRGAFAHDTRATIHYKVYAPATDRVVTTLVQVARTAPDAARIPGGPGCDARATLLMYRVLAPRLVLRVFPCGGNKKGDCAGCELDAGVDGARGGVVLRPRRALTPCGCSCYRLRVTNTTPIPTTVRWEPPIDGEDYLKVKFLPNDFDIGSYGEKEIMVILEPRNPCGRRLFALRAHVAHAYRPLYLLIDTAIDGVKIVCEVPLGGGEVNDSFIELRGSQKEIYPWDPPKPSTPLEWFLEEDCKRATAQEHRCDCSFEMKYIPPIKPLRPPRGEDETPSTTEILTSPPSLTRVCECFDSSKPLLPEHEEPCCLQFRDLPIRTVKSRTLKLRNVGHVTARWRAVVRRWPRQRNRAAATEALTTGKDLWPGDVRAPGVVIQCLPEKGICAAGQGTEILVKVYADTWGLYYNQIMLLVDHVDAIVIDIWIEAVGSPLLFARAPYSSQSEFDATMWLSTSDPERSLRVKNTSRSQLTVHAYTLLEHEHSQDAWPFRMYIRFIDVQPPVCPCSTYASSNLSGFSENSSVSSVSKKMDTDIGLYLTADYGLHDEEYYQVEPDVCTVAPGAWMEWRVSLRRRTGAEPAPPGLVLLRTIPDDDRGDHWRRWEPPPGLLGVRVAPRAPALRLSCRELRVQLCALKLQYNDVARIRKRFRMRNIGTAPLLVSCCTEAPWQLVTDKPKNYCGHCGCKHEPGQRHDSVKMLLEPWSCAAMCVEVALNTTEMWPDTGEVGDVSKNCVLPSYPPRRLITGQVKFSSDQELLETMPLILDVDFPRLSLEPETIDFGFVTHGDTRKTYFSVWHSSLRATIALAVSWHGSASLRLYPRHLRLEPGQRARIYLQYTAKWTGAAVPVEGCLRVSAAAGAGAWCRGALFVRAQPARDAKFRQEVHDHTDQWNLWPPSLPQL